MYIIYKCCLLIETEFRMWHEARRQEKKIRGLMVDFKKRADRRKEFYEKIVSNYLCLKLFLFYNLDKQTMV